MPNEIAVYVSFFGTTRVRRTRRTIYSRSRTLRLERGPTVPPAGHITRCQFIALYSNDAVLRVGWEGAGDGFSLFSLYFSFLSPPPGSKKKKIPYCSAAATAIYHATTEKLLIGEGVRARGRGRRVYGDNLWWVGGTRVYRTFSLPWNAGAGATRTRARPLARQRQTPTKGDNGHLHTRLFIPVRRI